MSDRPINLAVLFSGGGSTLQNLIDATRDGRLPDAQVACAVSSRSTAGGVARCEREGVPCRVVAKADYPDPAEHSRAIFDGLDPATIDYVVLAGWMSRLVLREPWLDRRVINVHPSLLPSFGGVGMYGRRVHEAVLAAGERETGCTVHWVDNEYDHGDVIAQQRVPVRFDDTADTLAARVQAAERDLYVRVIRSLPRVC